MVSDIDRRKGLSATGCGGSVLGLDTDLLEGGRDRLDPRQVTARILGRTPPVWLDVPEHSPNVVVNRAAYASRMARSSAMIAYGARKRPRRVNPRDNVGDGRV